MCIVPLVFGISTFIMQIPMIFFFWNMLAVFGGGNNTHFGWIPYSQIRGHESEMPMPPTTFASFVCQKFKRIFLSELLL
jgi:hypothetical protein